MHTTNGFLNAIKQFERAIENDPRFAIAYAYLADTYAHLGHLESLMPPEKARAQGTRTAEKALAIEPENAEAMAALALIYANEDRQEEAFDLMTRSLANKPGDAHSRHRLSWLYANKGNIDRAVEEMRIAQRLDPQSAYINQFLAEMLLLSRKPGQAILYRDKALEIEPTSVMAHWRKVEAFEQRGELDAAEKELRVLKEKTNRDPSVMLLVSRIYAKNDKMKRARQILNDAILRSKNESNNKLIAYSEIALGDKSNAVNRIVKVIDGINDNIYTIKYDPLLDPIREDPAFAEALKRKEEGQGW